MSIGMDLIRSLENMERVFPHVVRLALASPNGIYVLDLSLKREVGALASVLQSASSVVGSVPNLVYAYANPGEAMGRALIIYPAGGG
ncbi:hypothetical protein [Thermocladium modestius]|nr:hypothetical protein [Thermocladium modestius]